MCNLVRTPVETGKHVVLNQERVFPAEYGDGAWVLDRGATNHMTGCKEGLASLDEGVSGTVRFGDGSVVKIHGIGAVTLTGRNQEHRVLTEVFYIPSLKCNILSLGQLEEGGCTVEIDNGILTVLERRQARVTKRGGADTGRKEEPFIYSEDEHYLSRVPTDEHG